ncbi:Codeine O-demethylase [Vitis vinifera]|uniref:Codeine O-demethylase n=1 Tax=Vitis vinifera TaxID=29760 RepID=A0A438GGE6_VITVI|nr:Codeine O-demethylase [Vitis vinifera]
MCVHGCIVGEPWSEIFTCGETEIGDRRILQTSLGRENEIQDDAPVILKGTGFFQSGQKIKNLTGVLGPKFESWEGHSGPRPIPAVMPPVWHSSVVRPARAKNTPIQSRIKQMTSQQYLLPELPSLLRDSLECYLAELQKLAMMLLGFMAKALKLEKGEMEELFEDGMQSVRITYYPPCPQPELVMGLTPHSDATGITILLQINGVDGLQIKKDGVWIPVSFLPDALVVNVGDVLEILSNGVYTSIEHRATVNAAKERISIAMFFNPKFSAQTKPAPSQINPQNPPLFKQNAPPWDTWQVQPSVRIFLMGHGALSTLHPDDHGTGVLSTLPCPDVLSRPNASVLDKSLDCISQTIIIYTTKSMLDGTLLGHFRQPVTICNPPPAEQKDRDDGKSSLP